MSWRNNLALETIVTELSQRVRKSGKLLLAIDSTVDTVFGEKIQDAERGYNPHKPGRPSHTYHTYMMANLRLVLDVEVQSGTKTAASYSAPGLWALLERMPKTQWPTLVRGDCDWGN